MTFIAPTTRALAEFITPAIWNQDVVDNENAAFPLGVGAWTAWSPTLTNLTLGSGTSVAAYQRVGRIILWRYAFTYGAGSAVGTDPTISLPVATAAGYTLDHVMGAVVLCDVGSNVFEGLVTYATSTTVKFWALNSAGTYVVRNSVTSTVPHTWAAPDQILATGWYEAAS